MMIDRTDPALKGSNSREASPCPPLRQLYVYLTDGCNLACRHCWLAPKFDKNGDKSQFLPVDQLMSVIEEAMELGLRSVKLTGGEPLLHPHCIEIIRMVGEKKLAFTMETNGLLCDETIAREIGKLSEKFVSVSIDGADAAVHDRIRGVPGAFEKACAGVRNLAVAGLQPQVIMTVMRANVAQAAGMVNLAERLGAGSVKFNVVQPTARGKSLYEDSQALDIREVIALGNRVEKVLSNKTRLNLFFDFPMAFRTIKRMFDGDGCAVCSLFGIMGVLADGHYALCGIGAQVPELVFGQTGRDPLETVWRENEMLRQIREGLPDRLEGICGRCLMKGKCLGACLAQNYYRRKNLWAPYWFCEMAEEAGLFPSSRLVPS